jgi:hypothetical protein
VTDLGAAPAQRLGAQSPGPGGQQDRRDSSASRHLSDRARAYGSLVRLFARSPALVDDGEAHLDVAWLAGVLEAEGTFIQPTPSEPRFPIVACQMTDRDVVEQVGSMFGTTVTTIRRDGRRMV